MKETANITCLVLDHNLFLPLALRLGESFKRVLYHTPWERGFPLLNDCVIGDGFPEIERCDDIWGAIDAGEVDLVVCPDIMHAGLQLHLEKLGIPVWGSRKADSIELNREKFMRILAELKLDVAPFEKVVGTTALAQYLRPREDVYVKISKYRGSMETTHFRSWELDENFVHRMALRFGTCRDKVPFLVFDSIDTDLELGCDTYCVDGQWPGLMLQGYEWKDKGYFASVTEHEKMPEHVQAVLDAFGPVLAPYRYRNEFSMELRKKGEQAFFIDPTCRGGLPSTGSQIVAWKNLPEIIWYGANGQLIEPEPDCNFTAECVLTIKTEKCEWGEIIVPDELAPWMKLAGCCQVDGVLGFPPSEGDEIGWLVAKGDTPTETIERMKDLAAKLPPGVTAHLTSLVDLLKEIEKAEAEDIKFTDQKMPAPETVVSD